MTTILTLFVTTPRRRYEISDAYVVALTFIIVYSVGRIVRAVIEKRQATGKQSKDIKIRNPRGGSMGFSVELADDTDLVFTILSCINDNERYLIKDPELRKIIFNLVKAKVQNESLILIPNMMRFLALKLINKDQTLMVRLGNVIFSSDNRVRLTMRFFGSLFMASVAVVTATLPYAVLMTILYFDVTQNCGYPCHEYFEQLPSQGTVRVYGEQSSGHLIIAGNEDARQVEIYTQSPSSEPQVVTHNNNEISRTTVHRKSKKKAQEVKFSDFRKLDPVLSAFQNIEEPLVPQKVCPIKDVVDKDDVD